MKMPSIALRSRRQGLVLAIHGHSVSVMARQQNNFSVRTCIQYGLLILV